MYRQYTQRNIGDFKMTEKRFIFHSTEIEDTLETDVDYKYTSCNKDGFQDLCEMLNELAEENEGLKQQVNELRGKASSWKITASEEMVKQSELVKENEQLKHSIKCLEADKMELQQYIKRTQGDVE